MSATTNTKQLRRTTEDGTEYLVADVVAQREGVYTYPDGDGGARHEFVPGEELATNAESWNDTPLVLEHPEGPNGRPVSVNHPNADTTEIGEFRNAHPNSDGDALAGEVWFRENEVGAHGGALQRYIDDLDREGAGEVSTGYNAGTIETAEGTHDGRRYNYVQRDLQPDHLAVLPGEQTGDCSVADGCGVGVVANHADDTAFRANRALAGGGGDGTTQDGGPYAQLGRRVADAIGLGEMLGGGRINAGGAQASDEEAESSGGESAPPSADDDNPNDTMSLDDEEKIDRLVEDHQFTRENLEGLDGTKCLTRIHEEFAETDPDDGGDGGSDGGDGDGGDGGDGDGASSSAGDGGSSGDADDDPDDNMSEDLTPDAIRDIVQDELDAQTDQVVDAVEQARANERHVELIANSDEYPLDAEDLADMDAAAVEKLADEIDADAAPSEPARANYAGTPTGASFDASEASDSTDVPAAGYETYRQNTESDD